MNSKSVGESSEAQVLAALLKAGKIVLMPFGDNQRYDMVVHEETRFVTIQVKTARDYKNGSIVFNTSSYTTKKGKPVSVPYHGQIDLFAVYYPKTDQIFMVPVKDTGSRGFHIRLQKPKNKGVSCNYAENYLFDPFKNFIEPTGTVSAGTPNA